MKTFLLAAAAVLVMWISLGMDLRKDGREEEVVYTEKDFDASAIQRLEASTSAGFVRVDGGAADRATVAVILAPNGTKWPFRKKSLERIFEEEYDLKLAAEDGVLAVRAKRKKGRGRNARLSVSFRITVPTRIDSDVRTSAGSITLRDLQGIQRFRTSAGSLKLSGLSGDINGKTSAGSIDMAGCSGDIALSTSAGSIDMADCAGRIKAASSAGSIRASLKQVSDSLRLTTSAGGVRIAVPESAYDVDLKGLRVALNISGFSGTVKEKSVQGKVNGGGSAIVARTSSGSVSLSWLR